MYRRLKKLFSLLDRRDKQWLILILFSMLLASALEAVSIGSVPLLITLVADPSRLQGLPMIGNLSEALVGLPQRQLVIWGGLGFLLVFLVRTAALVLAKYMQFRYAATRQVRISTELFNRYLRAPYLFHLRHNSSELIRNIQTGAMRIGGQVIGQILGGLQQALMLVSILLLLLFADPLVTLVGFMVFGLFGAIFIRMTSMRTKALGALEMRERKESLQALRQSLEGVREIQLVGKPAFFVRGFKGRMRNVAQAQRDKQIFAFVSGPLLEMLAILTLIAITFTLLAIGRAMADTIAMLGLFAVAFVRMKGSLAMVLGTYTNLNYSLVSIDPVYDGLTQLRGMDDETVQGESLQFEDRIELDNVSFSYPSGDGKVLDKVTLSIPKGAYIGLVGTTGAGKSTLVNTLLGILPPDEGKVLVDGRDIKTDLKVWQQTIGYVPQDLFLLDDSIRRNVALGINDENIDEEQVKDALRKAQLLDFVNSLSAGMDTHAGERGVRLSGGQKQRISIARALYRNPQVLVLDEATASLDNDTEEEFLNAVLGLKNQVTIISVAHRATTLRDCDSTYRVRDGQLGDLSSRQNKRDEALRT